MSRKGSAPSKDQLAHVATVAPEVDYDAGWTRWGDMVKYSPAPFHRRRLILELARTIDFQSVLDVGCGPGELLRTFRAEFPSATLTGVDLSGGVVASNRQAMPDVQFHAADISSAPLSGQWDLIVCSEVIEHIPDYPAAVRHLRQMCGKHIIITVPSGRIFPIDRSMGHHQHFAPDEMAALLESCGFRPAVLWRWGFPWHTIYKHLINVSPSASLSRFGGSEYSASEKLVARALTSLFYLNSRRLGSQLVVLAEAVS
jgi:SAM-dependent methyltransferase